MFERLVASLLARLFTFSALSPHINAHVNLPHPLPSRHLRLLHALLHLPLVVLGVVEGGGVLVAVLVGGFELEGFAEEEDGADSGDCASHLDGRGDLAVAAKREVPWR